MPSVMHQTAAPWAFWHHLFLPCLLAPNPTPQRSEEPKRLQGEKKLMQTNVYSVLNAWTCALKLMERSYIHHRGHKQNTEHSFLKHCTTCQRHLGNATDWHKRHCASAPCTCHFCSGWQRALKQTCPLLQWPHSNVTLYMPRLVLLGCIFRACWSPISELVRLGA